MKEFHKIDSNNKEIHFIIHNKGYGKRYRILNNGAIELIEYLLEMEDFI